MTTALRGGAGSAAKGAAQSALVGLGFAVAELGRLRLGGLELEPSRVAPIAVAYVLLAVGIGLAASLACSFVRLGFRRTVTPPLGGRTIGTAGLESLLEALPLAAVLFVFSATIVNVLWLGRRTSASSLLADALLLLVSFGCAAFVARLGGRAARRLVAAAVILLAAFSAWIVTPRSGPRSTAVAAISGRPHIVFVLIDTLRADHLGIYGYDRSTSPFVDELATQSLVFDRAYSTSNWTRPAVASIFTSTMPSRHGAIVHHQAPSAELPLLASELQQAGYRTGFFTAGVNVEASDGYDRGVDHFFSAHRRNLLELTAVGRNWLLPAIRRWGDREPGADGVYGQVRPAELVDRALAWQREQPSNRPLFLYLHFHGPHTPYAPPAPSTAPSATDRSTSS